MDEYWKEIAGVVIPGHQVASRKSEHYPMGTIEMQAPFFKELGLDLSSYYQGTLNISVAPIAIRVINPEHTFRGVRWTTAHPPEDFSFSRCLIIYNGEEHEGWIYYPHPETKERHFQDPTIVEVIAPFIPGLKYGERVAIRINGGEIAVKKAT